MLVLYNRTLISRNKDTKKNIKGDNHQYVAINSYKLDNNR